MRCPFPGMDPWLERTEVWRDFHARMITHICDALQPQVNPRYFVTSDERVYQPETFPRIHSARFSGTPEPITEHFTSILDESCERIVTSIEILSPATKSQGPGRHSYIERRNGLLEAGANLVEIDLLAEGLWTILAPEGMLRGESGRYLIGIVPARGDIVSAYPVGLRDRLPRLAIPLDTTDHPAILDLQAVFEHVWDFGPYPRRLLYDQLTPPGLSAEDVAWCRERIQAAGYLP